MKGAYFIVLLCVLFSGCAQRTANSENATSLVDSAANPTEILDFSSYEQNPVFKGTGMNTWDQKIRERGFILREDGLYHMWYTGFRDEPDAVMHLGYATSLDGLVWTRYADNPVFDAGWVEDMMVIKSNSTYYMFAEGKDDIAHLLTHRKKRLPCQGP